MRRTCITLLLLLSLPIAAFPLLASEAKLRRLIQLSVGPQQQQQAEGYLLQWQTKPWTIQFIGIGQGQFDIAQYHALSLQAASGRRNVTAKMDPRPSSLSTVMAPPMRSTNCFTMLSPRPVPP